MAPPNAWPIPPWMNPMTNSTMYTTGSTVTESSFSRETQYE